MPNHVTNILEVEDLGGVPLQDFHSHILNPKTKLIDFNIIVPMPAQIKNFEPSFNDIELARNWILSSPRKGENVKREGPEHNSVVRRCIKNYLETGYFYWYDWCYDHWGTKWNAYDQAEGGWPDDTKVFKFNTAWSHPVDLLLLLSQRLPTVKMRIQYADEDIGVNCGSYILHGGKISLPCIAPSSNDMNKAQRRFFTMLAFNIYHPSCDPKDYGYNEEWDYNPNLA